MSEDTLSEDAMSERTMTEHAISTDKPSIHASLKEFVLEGTPHDTFERYAELPKRAKTTDFAEYDTNVVVIDTETTGVSLKKDELTQIAAAKLIHGEITEWFVTFVNPGQAIPEDIQHLTNITDEDVADASAPEEALADLVEFVGDAKLVAHNAAFDRNFCTKHPQGYPLLENDWIDSLDLSRIALPCMKSHRLIDLVKAFGAPLSTHRADDDVVATCALYPILLAAVDAMPEDLLHTIAGFATPDEWFTQKVFAFFAQRKLAAATEARLTKEERALGRVVLPETVDLKKMRAKRIAELDMTPKEDAASMVSAELLEGMKTTNVFAQSFSKGDFKTITFPSAEELERAFSQEGLLGEIYPDYETRSQQLEMAIAVRDAFSASENLMIEAGTGTGKSMAYLVPAALTAKRNNIGIGIATKTNALLDQLVYKELPALAEGLAKQAAGERDAEGAAGVAGAEVAANGESAVTADVNTPAEDAANSDAPLTFAPLKGYTHYPCLWKIQWILREGPKIVKVAGEEKSQAPALAALLSYIQQTNYNDIDNLKIDYRTLPRGAITTTSNDCLKRRCPFYGELCYVQGSRTLALCSDIVVTNHSLLFCDAAAQGALLPQLRYWIADEAHGCEEEARRALSVSIAVDKLAQLVKRVSSEDARANVFLHAARSLKAEGTGETLFHALIAKATSHAKTFAEASQEFAAQAHELLFFDPQKKSSYELFDLWINQEVRNSTIFTALRTYAQNMVEAAERLTLTAQDLVSFMEDEKDASFAQREIAMVTLELKDVIQAANTIFLQPSDKYVYAVTLNRHENKDDVGAGRSGRSRGGAVFHAFLYNVGEELDETLYNNTRSVVYTSATLTVEDSFETFEQAMGLNMGEQSQAEKLKLDPCFDFDNNMKVYVVTDMPEPSEPAYLERLQAFLHDAHIAQQGSMLTLFTNKKEMDKCFSAVHPSLKEANLRLICQKWGVSVKGLRDEFVVDETLSLFALKSFWEGFDAPGSTLRGVIIPRLPFTSPTDPLSRERKDRDRSSWMHFDLPKAVLEVRQAAGRLIRKVDDTGVLILADSRIINKGYGRAFINSLPSSNVHYLTAEEICYSLSGTTGT